MSIALKPVEDRIIIKQASAETTTQSGLVIPDSAKEKPQQGEVLAAGPGKRDEKGNLIPMDVKAGDKILFSRYGGSSSRRIRTASPSNSDFQSSSFGARAPLIQNLENWSSLPS